jgi:acyl carrier protein
MHAATVIDDALVAELSPERFDPVMAPKVTGTWNLYNATAEDKLDFMVLFSSIASVYPQPGQGSYAAANAFMDFFAHWARARGRKVTSINWGGWERIGLARETGTGRSISGYAQQGLATMAGPRALSALKRAMELDLTQTLASPIDVEQAAEFFGAGRVPPVLRRLLAQSHSGRPSAEQTDVQRRLACAGSREESLEVLRGYLGEELGRVLKLAPERIGRDTLFGSIGLDSLMTLEFVRRLKAGLGVAIPTTAVFNYPTTHLLAAEIAKRMQLHPEQSGPESNGGPEASVKTDLHAATSALVDDAMSDDEALQALMQTMGN